MRASSGVHGKPEGLGTSWLCMGVFINHGPCVGSPCNKDHSIFGSILEPPVYGSSRILLSPDEDDDYCYDHDDDCDDDDYDDGDDGDDDNDDGGGGGGDIICIYIYMLVIYLHVFLHYFFICSFIYLAYDIEYMV